MDVRRTPVLHGSRVTLRPPAAEDADAARRIGLHPEILRVFGEEAGDAWRELDAVALDGVAYADVIMRLEAGRYRLLAATWENGS